MAEDINKEFESEIIRFKNSLRETIGSTIKKPMSATLGYKDDSGTIHIRVPESISNQPSTFYFTQASGQPFVGQAYLREGVIADWQLRYGTPIRIRKDVLNDTIWEIIGLDVIYSNEFFRGVTSEILETVPLERFEPGLLTSTTPASMRAVVKSGIYDFGDNWIAVKEQFTVNWSQAPYNSYMPDVGDAIFVLVQISPTDGTLSYKYGDPVPANITFEQAYALQDIANTEIVLPQRDKNYFRVGYIKLIGGQSAIDRRSIWSAQQVLGSSSDGASLKIEFLQSLVTDEEDVVTAGGEVVWIE